MSKIIPKKVEMIELFYDLIFVFAIAKITAIIHHPHHGHIAPTDFIKYIIVSLVVLQVWLYQTNFINRYGKATLIDNVLLCINMGATVYLANSINTDWSITFNPFNISMIIMLSTLIIQFSIQLRKEKNSFYELRGFLISLSAEVIGIFIGLMLGYEKGLYIVIFSYALGILLPFVVTKKHIDIKRTNFPHLAERMGLIVIISFGEMIINVTQLFDIKEFSILPVLVFASVVVLFSTYVLQIDKLLNHHQHNQGFILLYSHFGILTSLGIITVSWGFLIDASVERASLINYLMMGLIAFYGCLFANSVYNKIDKKFTKKDFIIISTTIALTYITLFIVKENNNLIGAISLLSATTISGLLYTKLKRKTI